VAQVSFPALRTALSAIFSLIFVTGTTDRKRAFATSHKKLAFRSNPNIIPTNLTDATIHLAHGFRLQIHTFPTHATKALSEEEETKASCLDHPILLSWVGKILHSQISYVFRKKLKKCGKGYGMRGRTSLLKCIVRERVTYCITLRSDHNKLIPVV
jgi:hypothetical protein